MTPTDRDLVDAYHYGDREAFGVLYDRYIEKIYRFIYYKTFDTEIAEDLTSSTFFKALNKIGTLDTTKGGFSAWLYSIARNTVIDHYRTNKFSANTGEDVFDLVSEELVAETVDTNQTLKRVTAYLSNLSREQREIVTLRLWEERSYQEIAEIIGGTETAARMSFSRTMKKLRADLGNLSPLAIILLTTAVVTKW